MSAANAASSSRGRWLDRIERVGNALPDPTTLFLLGTFAVLLLSECQESNTRGESGPPGGEMTGGAMRMKVWRPSVGL